MFNPIDFALQMAKQMANVKMLAMIASGPMGWAVMGSQMLMSGIMNEFIKVVGQELGLPPAVINMAQRAFAQSSGLQGMPTSLQDAISQVSQMGNFSPREQGELQSIADAALQMFRDNFKYDRNAVDERGNARGRGQAQAQLGQGGQAGQVGQAGNVAFASNTQFATSWLMRIAELLGNILEKAAAELEKASNATDWKDAKSMSKFNALVQLFNTLMNSINSAIKALGEALTAMARKN